MILTVTGRHLALSTAVRQQIEKKIGRLTRLLNHHAVSAQCVVGQERKTFVCEITLHARGDHMLVGVGRHERLTPAVGAAIEKVAQQANRLADRWKTSRRRGRRLVSAAVDPAGALPGPRVVRARRYEVKLMGIDDAVVALTTSDHGFVVFRQVPSNDVAVLFRRSDGHFGLIDTAD